MGNVLLVRRATKNHQNWQQFATLVIFSPLFIHTASARARPGTTPSSSSPDEVERPSAATWSVWCYSNFYDTKHVAVREQRCRERSLEPTIRESYGSSVSFRELKNGYIVRREEKRDCDLKICNLDPVKINFSYEFWKIWYRYRFLNRNIREDRIFRTNLDEFWGDFLEASSIQEYLKIIFIFSNVLVNLWTNSRIILEQIKIFRIQMRLFPGTPRARRILPDIGINYEIFR